MRDSYLTSEDHGEKIALECLQAANSEADQASES